MSTRWVIFAGPSLRDPKADPIQMLMDKPTADGLHCGDRGFWKGLLSAVQDDLSGDSG